MGKKNFNKHFVIGTFKLVTLAEARESRTLNCISAPHDPHTGSRAHVWKQSKTTTGESIKQNLIVGTV